MIQIITLNSPLSTLHSQLNFVSTNFIQNADGSAYHLHLLKEHVATTIITVGDPERVKSVAKHFKSIEHNISHREFVTCTGTLQNDKRVTVISTGIGTDNIEIVVTEIDALFNWDVENNAPTKTITPLTFIRIGTTGAIRAEIPVGSFLVAERAIGFDNVMHYYDYAPHPEELLLAEELVEFFERRNDDFFVMPYAFRAEKKLVDLFADTTYFKKGNTVTTPGFYAPQGRKLRLNLMEKNLVQALNKFSWSNIHLSNLEMETAALYGMSRLLGHKAISVSVVLANRVTDTFSENPQVAIDSLIEKTMVIVMKDGGLSS